MTQRMASCPAPRASLPLWAASLACLLASWPAARVESATPEPAAQASAFSLVDDASRSLRLARPAQRIVSLAPGATAMLFAAGAGERVVGTARFSDEPEAARRIARVGDSAGYDLERILALRPDVVVAWSGGMAETQIARLERAGLIVYRHRVVRLADVPAALERLSQLIGNPPSARAAAAALRQRIGALHARRANRPTVLLEIWDRPLYTVGSEQLMSDALEACGYRNAFSELRAAGPAISLEAALARDPDFIVAVAPGEAQAREWLARWRGFPALKAVRNGRLIGLADQRFSRLGPAAIDAAEALCRQLDAR